MAIRIIPGLTTEASQNFKYSLMEHHKLFDLRKPAVYVTAVNDDSFANLFLQLTIEHKDSIIRIIRGNKSKTIPDFFNEIAAALQFPYYFGENGAAFRDCITDLDWTEGDAYLLMFSHADSFLCDSSDEAFYSIMEIFSDANTEWLTPNQYIPRNRQPTPFHLLFQCADFDSNFIQRLRNAKIDFESL